MVASIIEYGSKEETIKRKHYRIGCLWEVNCKECQSEAENEEDGWFQATTTDISGGGCRFNATSQLTQDGILRIKINNPEKNKVDELSFKAKVIASQLLPNREGIYETRVKFVNLSFWEQEQLIRWIFEEKRKFKWQERGLENEEKYFDY